MKIRTLGCLLCFFLVANADEDGIYNLGQVEVIAGVDAIGSDAVIDQKEIEDSASSTVDQAIRFTPGIYTTPFALGSRGESDIGIRGFGRTQIGLFIDGIPVSSIYDRQTDWAQFGTYDVSQIEIAKGFVSPIYGINSMGGAVNIISQKPQKALEAGVKLGYFDGGEAQVGFNVGTLQENWYSSFSYFLIDRNSYPLSNSYQPTSIQPGPNARNAYYKNQTFKAKVGVELDGGDEYSLNAIISRGEKGGTFNAYSGGRYWDWPQYDKNTIYFLGQTNFSQNFSLNSKLYWDNFVNRLVGKGQASNANSGFKGISDYDDHSFGLIETIKYQINDAQDLQFGTNLRYNHTNNDNFKLVSNGFSKGEFDDADEYEDFQTSIFAQFSHDINDMFAYIFSVGYDRVDTISAYKDRSAKNSGNLDYETDVDDYNAQAIFFTHWDGENTTHFNLGKKNNLPTLKDRYGTPWGQRVPNPDLGTESIYNFEIGHNFANNSQNFGATIFYNLLDNAVVTTSGHAGCSSPATSGSTTTCYKLENVDGGHSWGVEISANSKFFDDKLNLGANYTYTQKHTSAISNDGTPLSKIEDYPNHIANAFIGYSPLKQVDLILNATFRSHQYTYDATTGYGYDNADLFLMDFKANFRPTKAWELSVGATNLLDKNYYYNGGYFMAGRRVFVSAQYKY